MVAALAICGSAFLWSIRSLRDDGPNYWRYPDTAQGSHQAYEDYIDRGEFAIRVLIGSIAGATAVLLAGVVYAYGLGPDWMARKSVGAKVEERLTLKADGTLICGGDALERGRHYLRLRLPDGTVTELACPGDLLAEVEVGSICNVEAVGRRLVSLHVVARPDSMNRSLVV